MGRRVKERNTFAKYFVVVAVGNLDFANITSLQRTICLVVEVPEALEDVPTLCICTSNCLPLPTHTSHAYISRKDKRCSIWQLSDTVNKKHRKLATYPVTEQFHFGCAKEASANI